MITQLKKHAYHFNILFASIVAIGTFPYGFRFSYIITTHPTLQAILGVYFGITATFMNTLLGLYSLNNLKQYPVKIPIYCLSLFGALSTGCICYFGYKSTLPFQLNIIISIAVFLVNMCIGVVAMHDLFASFTTKSIGKNKSLCFRLVGSVIGLSVSIVSFLAVNAGMTVFMRSYHLTLPFCPHLAYLLAFFSWIPTAALFMSANQNAVGQIYNTLASPHYIQRITRKEILWVILALSSGSAYFEITHELFDIQQSIPDLFKSSNLQTIGHFFIKPLSLLSSAAINYVFLKRILTS